MCDRTTDYPLFGLNRVIERIFFCLSVMQAIPGYAEHLDVRGSIHYESNFKFKGTFLTIDKEFSLTADDCRWVIKLKDPKQAFLLSEQVVFDGTNCMSTILFNPEYTRGEGKNNGTGEVQPGPVPDPAIPSLASYLWLGYLSDCYFAEKRARAKPVWVVADTLKAAKYQPAIHLKLSDSRPHLPVNVSFFVDDDIDLITASANDIRSLMEEAQFSPKVDEKRLWAHYRITEFAAVGDFKLPKRFECAVYEPVAPGSASQIPKIVYHVECLATNIDLGAGGKVGTAVPAAWLPPAGARLVVDDYRAQVAGKMGMIPIQYAVTNGVISAANSPAYRTSSTRAVALAEVEKVPLPKNKWLRFVVLGCSVFSALVLGWIALVYWRQLSSVNKK